MRPVAAVPVAPGASVALEPGGLHVMLSGLRYPLREGSSFPLTLTFEDAGSATITGGREIGGGTQRSRPRRRGRLTAA